MLIHRCSLLSTAVPLIHRSSSLSTTVPLHVPPQSRNNTELHVILHCNSMISGHLRPAFLQGSHHVLLLYPNSHQAESRSLKLKHGTADPRNYTELHVTQLFTNAGCTHEVISVEKGKTYLMRLISSADLVYTTVCFEGHNVTVIATDAFPVAPFVTSCVDLNVAQR